MYYKIEKEYIKQTKRNKKIMRIFIVTIISLSYVTFINNIHNISFIETTIILFLLIFLSCTLHQIYKIKKFINKNKTKMTNLKEIIEIYKNQTQQQEINILIKILNNTKITNKEDIKMLIDYYENKQPIDIKKGMTSWIIEGLALIISIISLGFNENDVTFNVGKFTYIICYAITIMFLIYSLRSIIEFIKLIINKPDTDLYLDLEDKLRIIYLDYDKYFRKKHINIITKFCDILSK